jgi:translation initiation factor 3 subunit G
MSKLATNWADDEEFDDASSLPPQTVTTNKDGTKTVVSYSLDESGKKVKTTRRIRTRIVRETVNPRVAERKEWAKFGLEKSHPPGPSSETTTIGENILFRPSVTWRKDGKDEAKKAEEESVRDKLRDKKVKCRICSGDHFTAHCPYKDTMAPVGEEAGPPDAPTGATAAGLRDENAAGKLGAKSGSYVPPALRNGGTATGERMSGGKYERDDLATLRVTNVSEVDQHYFPNANGESTGLRNGRGRRFARHIRALWAGYACISGQRSRDRAGQGFCIY